jgi:hypothetical protein
MTTPATTARNYNEAGFRILPANGEYPGMTAMRLPDGRERVRFDTGTHAEAGLREGRDG